MTKTALTAALHAKSIETRHLRCTVAGVEMIGTSYALYSVEYLTANMPAGFVFPTAETVPDNAAAPLATFVEKATTACTLPRLFALSLGILAGRFAPDVYVDRKYSDVLDTSLRFYHDANLKGTPVIAKTPEGRLVAMMMPVTAKDADYSIRSI